MTDPLTDGDRKDLLDLLKEDEKETPEAPPSVFGGTLGGRPAFADYHRKLLAVLKQIDRMAVFVSGMPMPKRDVVFQIVYSETVPAIRTKLTLLAFGRIPRKVRSMLDDPAYMRLVCSPGVSGLRAKARLINAISDLIVAPSSSLLLQKAVEPSLPPTRPSVETVDVE